MPKQINLRFSSSQAPNAYSAVTKILQFINTTSKFKIDFVRSGDWASREKALEAGNIDLGWICGLPYVWKADDPDIKIELLAAPVMKGDRYLDQPLYFSDVVVRRDSSIQKFEDLRGKSWAINETASHSGYNIARYFLAQKRLDGMFFSRVQISGSHQSSLLRILDGKVDAAAIDSTVLETELRKIPELGSEIRIIEQMGPSPIPPWIIHKSVPEDVRLELREFLLTMDQSRAGREALDSGAYARFEVVSDNDYDPIRNMFQLAKSVRLLDDNE